MRSLLSLAAVMLLALPSLGAVVIVNGQTDIDLNNDGVADISFFYLPDCPSGGFIRVTAAGPGGGIVSHGQGAVPFADMVPVGTAIGPSQTFVGAANIMTCGF